MTKPSNVCVLDANVFAYIVAYNIAKKNITCEKQSNEYYKCYDENKNEFTIHKSTLNSLISDLQYIGASIDVKDGKYFFKTTFKSEYKIKSLLESLKDKCKDILITPDVGLEGMSSSDKTIKIRNPIHSSISFPKEEKKEEKEEEKKEVYKSLWNEFVKETLNNLNAKVLLDNDLKTFLGKDVYNRLYGIWVNFVGKNNIYTDISNEIIPILKLKIKRGDIEGTVMVRGDSMSITSYTKSLDITSKTLNKHKALMSAKEVFEKSYCLLNESAEALKRILESESHLDKFKKYFGKEASIDAYLKAISRDDDVLVYTADKDITREIDIGTEPNPKNIILFS